MAVAAHEVQPGARVVVRGGFGHELPIEVRVSGVGDEGGAVVIDYFDPNRGQNRWAYLDQVESVVAPAPSASEEATAFSDARPRIRFMAACLRLEAWGSAEGASARRIFARSDLSDEIAVPDVQAAARIIRILNGAALSDPAAADQARIAIAALCDVLAPIDGAPI